MNNLLNKIRIRINDIEAFEFSNNELISYINNGLSNVENILAINHVKFNISLLKTTSSLCAIPNDLIQIYKIIENGLEIPQKDVISSKYGYYILNNNIVLPCTNADIYYIKEFPRLQEDDTLKLPSIIIEYLYLYTIIKALSRLEFNMDKEEKELLNTTNMMIKHMLHKYGNNTMERFNGYSL